MRWLCFLLLAASLIAQDSQSVADAARAARAKKSTTAAATAAPAKPAAKHVYTNDEIPSVSAESLKASIIDFDSDRPGFTFQVQPLGPLAKYDICPQICSRLSLCQAWVFAPGPRCDFKSMASNPVHKEGYVTGLKERPPRAAQAPPAAH